MSSLERVPSANATDSPLNAVCSGAASLGGDSGTGTATSPLTWQSGPARFVLSFAVSRIAVNMACCYALWWLRFRSDEEVAAENRLRDIGVRRYAPISR